MKKLITFVCAALAVSACGEGAAGGTKTAQPNLKGKKTLVAYYSYSGNTQAVARQIAKAVGADLFEIKINHTYPDTYNVMTAQAKKEIKEGFKPALTDKVNNMEQYQVVFVGSPIWWGTYAPAVASFLSAYNWQGKTVIPFFTHGGGGISHGETDMQKHLISATVGHAMAFPGRPSGAPEHTLNSWLTQLGF